MKYNSWLTEKEVKNMGGGVDESRSGGMEEDQLGERDERGRGEGREYRSKIWERWQIGDGEWRIGVEVAAVEEEVESLGDVFGASPGAEGLGTFWR